jgi:hypothetical protein
MSRDRMINVVVLLALAMLIAWVAANTYWTEVTIPTPLKGEAARNPFYAAQSLAGKLGARTEWRRNLGALPERNAVIVLWGWNWSLIKSRRESLERWVAEGGRLVLDRSLIGGEADLEQWSGVALHTPEEQEEDEEDEEDEENEEHDAQMETCRALELTTPGPASASRKSYTVCGMFSRTSLTSARRHSWALRDSNGMQAVRVPIARGSVTLINAWPFTWRALFDSDHAALLVAASQLRRGDTVLFLSEDEGTSLFALMWQEGSAVILLAMGLIALALWRGGVRFGPLAATPDPARRSLGEQIRGTGQFILRVDSGRALHAAASRALREAAQRRIPGFAALQAQERVAALARITHLDEDALADALHYAGPRRPGQLRNAIALLETARRSLTN